MDIAVIIATFQAVIAAAPKAIILFNKAKDYITEMWGAGLISKAEQDKLHAHLDAVQAAALAGDVPPHWEVEADPS